ELVRAGAFVAAGAGAGVAACVGAVSLIAAPESEGASSISRADSAESPPQAAVAMIASATNPCLIVFVRICRLLKWGYCLAPKVRLWTVTPQRPPDCDLAHTGAALGQAVSLAHRLRPALRRAVHRAVQLAADA